jgi:hypothetical protein
MKNGKLQPHVVSGVTPETTRETRVLPPTFAALREIRGLFQL